MPEEVEPGTDPDTTRSHWDTAYRSSPTERTGWYEATPALSLEMIDRCKLLRHATIVDAGVGASRLPDELLARGFERLVLVDVSEVALERVRARLGDAGGRVTYISGDLRQPDLLDGVGPVDLWHDRAALHFLVDERDRRAYAELLRRAVAGGGSVILAAYAPSGADH